MRILMVGAGAIGGYFGVRLLEAGREVTFLVRPERAAMLAKTGLTVRSEFGDAMLSSPPTVLAGALSGPFDLVIVSCKSYDLEAAIDAFAAAVGPETAVMPLLNGIGHLDQLDQRFGRQRVLGGQCFISVRIEDAGRIVHSSDVHRLSFGDRDEPQSARVEAIATALAGAKFDSEASPAILLEMWEKWIFLASFAGLTCLMRAAIGDIVKSGGAGLALAILEECRSIAAQSGWSPRPAFLEMARGRLTDPESKVTASMLGDIERGSRTEADHVLGDLLRRGKDAGVDCPFLSIAYMALQAYDARRRRESA